MTVATRRIPPHPALWPARQRRPQSQHREGPLPARGRAPGGAPRTDGRTHPAHATRAMPVLRWSDAHHRNLPEREKTAITGTAPCDGSMMKRPSPRLIQPRFPREHRSGGDCPRQHEPTQISRFSLDPATDASAIFGKGSRCAHPSRLKPMLIIMQAPDVGALSR